MLTKLGYSGSQVDKIMQSDVLLLPDDVDSRESYFTDKSVEVKSEIQKRLQIDILTRQGSKSHYQAQRAADIVLPTLIFLGWQAFDVGKGLLASLIYDMCNQYRYRGHVPKTKLRCIIIDKKEQIRKEIVAEGPADDLAKILREFKLAK
jgi:hypothetical protein